MTKADGDRLRAIQAELAEIANQYDPRSECRPSTYHLLRGCVFAIDCALHGERFIVTAHRHGAVEHVTRQPVAS